MDSRNRDTATTCDKNHPITHLHDELQRQLCDLKDLKYAYYAATQNRNVEPIIISNYPPSWVKSYKDNKSYLIDPIIKHGLKEIAPSPGTKHLPTAVPKAWTSSGAPPVIEFARVAHSPCAMLPGHSVP